MLNSDFTHFIVSIESINISIMHTINLILINTD